MFRIQLKKLREVKGVSQSKLASDFGISQGTVGNWESGIREPNFETISKLAIYFNVSVDYLLGNSEDVAPSPKAKKIPVLGNVAAGIPISAVENILDYEEISEDMSRTGEFFALRIHGNSMEPKISEGDVVIVRQQSDVESGQIAIVLVNGDDATCKKFVKHENGISLVSLNPAHSPMFFTPEEIESKPIRILGRVVELRAKF
ncbi:MAG: LexA family transcriptional regulator [Oscillospiraceae bacterium]|nr:LexA family transcriptional regulator [Oscillospiraceae bacterium]MBQ7120150.1 LexA family transcriptional regulator [Oscillospiraceae bacterium]